MLPFCCLSVHSNFYEMCEVCIFSKIISYGLEVFWLNQVVYSSIECSLCYLT